MKKKIFGLLLAAGLSVAAVEAQSGWVYQGCWNPFPTGTCYDVYRDASENYWQCGRCGTRTTKSCFKINPSIGYWCS